MYEHWPQDTKTRNIRGKEQSTLVASSESHPPPTPLAPYPYPLLTLVHLFTTTFLTFRTPMSPVDESAFSTKHQRRYEHKGVGEKLLQLLFNK